MILPRCSAPFSGQRRGPGPPEPDPRGRRKGGRPPCPRAGSSVRRAGGPDRVCLGSGAAARGRSGSVKTTRGAIHNPALRRFTPDPPSIRLARWRLAASRPVGPLPHGPCRKAVKRRFEAVEHPLAGSRAGGLAGIDRQAEFSAAIGPHPPRPRPHQRRGTTSGIALPGRKHWEAQVSSTGEERRNGRADFPPEANQRFGW